MRTMIVDEGRTDVLAWKCATQDFEFGTRLNVHESQMAVFFRDGQLIEVLGPGMHVLETRNFPFLRFFTKLRFGRYFHAEVYFVNLSVQMSLPWGTRERVNVMLEVEPGKAMPLDVGASGTMNVQPDPDQVKEMLVWLVGTGEELTAESLRDKFNSMLNTKIKTFLGRVLQLQHMNAFTLDQHLNDISQALFGVLEPEFRKYGVWLREFYVDAFALPEDNPAFQDARRLAEGRYIQHGKLDLEYELKLKQAEKEAQLARLEGEKTLVEADVAARANVTTAQGEAVRRSLEGITSVQEHQFATLDRMVDAGAAGGAGGAAGGGSGGDGSGLGDMTGFFGDVMKMGIGLEMMRNMGDVMKDAMNGAGQAGANMAQAASMNGNAGAGMPGAGAPGAGMPALRARVCQVRGWRIPMRGRIRTQARICTPRARDSQPQARPSQACRRSPCPRPRQQELSRPAGSAAAAGGRTRRTPCFAAAAAREGPSRNQRPPQPGSAAAAGGRTRRIRCSAAAAAAEGRSKREPAFLQGFVCGPKGLRRSKR